MHHLILVLTLRLCHCGKGVYRLPLSLPGGAAGGGTAGGALCQSSAEQQAERPAWLDFIYLFILTFFSSSFF